MERKIAKLRSEQPDRNRFNFREWLIAVVKFPLTLQHLVTALEQQNQELARYSQLPKTLADLTEVWQDFNSGFYKIFGGRVSYPPPQKNPTKDNR